MKPIQYQHDKRKIIIRQIWIAQVEGWDAPIMADTAKQALAGAKALIRADKGCTAKDQLVP